ncbi:MAG: selenium metabolism-associated LysR family transcriptional regulator [Thermodesulfovibrionales bacterium]|nr:selenium metabolism-associated LysR family transcriptional regulator [Thermodesulfovibrionales bacterium]
MDLHQLKVFVSVYKNRSFSKASEEIYLTQPTISDHIKSLEEELNCKLFDRLGRVTLPTPDADNLYPHVVDLLEKADNLKEIIQKGRNEVEGDIMIGASTIPGTYLLPQIMLSFKTTHPKVNFNVIIGDSSGIQEMVKKQDIYIGLIGAKMNSDRIVYEPFTHDELVLVAAKDYPVADSISKDDIRSLPLIIRESGSGTRKETEDFLSKLKIKISDLNIVMTLGSTEAVKEAVKAGLGCAVLSSFATSECLQFGVLKTINIEGLQMRRNFYIITHKKRELPKRYDLMRQHILKTFKDKQS